MVTAQLIEELEKIHCTLDKKHKLKVKSITDKAFTLVCPECAKIGINNTLKGSIKKTQKK